MEDICQAVQQLTLNGPSYLSGKDAKFEGDKNLQAERRSRTQEFIYDTILTQAKKHQHLIVLADSFTLSGTWPWLADKEINPSDINLNQKNHAEEDFRNVTFIRIRPDHAPKVVMEAPRTFVRINDHLRPAARRCDADLFRLTDTSEAMPTYYSFGTSIRTELVGGTSSYRMITKLDSKTGEEKCQSPWTKAWSTPNAIEITVLQHPKRIYFHPDDLAKLIEALRSEVNTVTTVAGLNYRLLCILRLF